VTSDTFDLVMASEAFDYFEFLQVVNKARVQSSCNDLLVVWDLDYRNWGQVNIANM
jgi:hypothetical protein